MMKFPAGATASRQLDAPARVLLVTDRFVLAELIRLTLDHGAFVVNVARGSSRAFGLPVFGFIRTPLQWAVKWLRWHPTWHPLSWW